MYIYICTTDDDDDASQDMPLFRHQVCTVMLQCVAVCCSVLQCVAVCCSVLQCVEDFAADVDDAAHNVLLLR